MQRGTLGKGACAGGHRGAQPEKRRSGAGEPRVLFFLLKTSSPVCRADLPQAFQNARSPTSPKPSLPQREAQPWSAPSASPVPWGLQPGTRAARVQGQQIRAPAAPALPAPLPLPSSPLEDTGWPGEGSSTGTPGPTHPGAARGRAAGGGTGPGPWCTAVPSRVRSPRAPLRTEPAAARARRRRAGGGSGRGSGGRRRPRGPAHCGSPGGCQGWGRPGLGKPCRGAARASPGPSRGAAHLGSEG